MKQELWLNLPVRDLTKTKAFFSALGFEALRDAPEMIGFKIGGVPVMMVTKTQFEKYALQTITDTTKSTEVLISIGAPDRAYIDDMVLKVEAAGGKVFSSPADIQGWMYGCAFADLDGHRWNLLYMDHHKM
ncbi:extradiol dioxygenase [Reichenbachiella agarivorans]|uniref:Extradiol dioxygenase n=1 Tax=Reichenbachiella agarivorans TaxID=2979464 RepID=A0ABY6CKB4_9BACT|nr:VOC family protein [Reichenbachiella agarivorans]UXP30961.1 extradiol dioxygenase [Reichenbachiella agarivorans]